MITTLTIYSQIWQTKIPKTSRCPLFIHIESKLQKFHPSNEVLWKDWANESPGW
jgi:hypothetical protein